MIAKKKYSEEDLITLINNGDQNAFAYLYDNYSKALFGIIYNILQDQEEAEDVLQNVFVKIWASFKTYNKEKGRLFTWMLNISRNAALDFLRSKQSNNSAQNVRTDDIVKEINKHHQQNVNYDHIGLKVLLNELKDEHRQLIDLAYYEGYTQEEISTKLDMPLGTVKTKVKQALNKLKEIVKG